MTPPRWLLVLALAGLAGCSDPPVRGAVRTIPEEQPSPDAPPDPPGVLRTRPRQAPPPPPEKEPPQRASLGIEEVGEAVRAEQGDGAEQLAKVDDLEAEADAATRARAAHDRKEGKERLARWDRERTDGREEALEAERKRWAARTSEGLEEWRSRAEAAAGGVGAPPILIAAEAERQARQAREMASRAGERASRARQEAEMSRRFARATVEEDLWVSASQVDLERTEQTALQLELEALRVEIAAEWAEEVARRTREEAVGR